MASLGEVIYSGSKSFWRTKSNLEITMVYHPSFHKYEIIAADPAKLSDERRLYADYYIVKTKLDHDLLERQAMEERGKGFENQNIHDRVVLKLSKEYLLSRLNMLMTAPNSPRDSSGSMDWVLVMQPAFNDTVNPETGKLDVLCARPLDLEPHSKRRLSSRSDDKPSACGDLPAVPSPDNASSSHNQHKFSDFDTNPPASAKKISAHTSPLAPIHTNYSADSKDSIGVLHQSISAAKDVDHMINPAPLSSHPKRAVLSPRGPLAPLQTPAHRMQRHDEGRRSPTQDVHSPLTQIHLNTDSVGTPVSAAKSSHNGHFSQSVTPIEAGIQVIALQPFSPTVPSSSGAGSEVRRTYAPHTPEHGPTRYKPRSGGTGLRVARAPANGEEPALEPSPPKDMRVDISRPRELEDGLRRAGMTSWAGAMVRAAQKKTPTARDLPEVSERRLDGHWEPHPGAEEAQMDSTVEVVSDVSGDDDYSHSSGADGHTPRTPRSPLIPLIDSTAHAPPGTKYLSKFSSWKDDVDKPEFNHDLQELEGGGGKHGKRRVPYGAAPHAPSTTLAAPAYGRGHLGADSHSPSHREGGNASEGHFLPSL